MPPFSPGVQSFLQAFREAPKAELHLHLEGSISASRLVRLSRRSPTPIFPDVEEVRRRQQFGEPRDFLSLYRDVCRCLRSPSDYGGVARDLVDRLDRERIVYAEVYVSPAIVERIGMSWHEVRGALEEVFRRFEKNGSRRIVVLLDSVRQWGPEAAHRVLDLQEAAPWPRVAGFGLGGEETSLPARDFRQVFDRARSLSLAPLVHAGEWGGADSVAECLEELRPIRIAHGFRAAEDKDLVRLLARTGTALDICLSSNRATRALSLSETHPALGLLRAGVQVSLSTDDPGLFRTTLLKEFRYLALLGATEGELRAVLENGFRGALRPVSRREPVRRRRDSASPSPRR